MTNTLLVSATGKTATLGSLASVTSDPGETEIRRENLQRLIQVTARLEGVDLGTGIAGVQKAVNDLHLPGSIRVEYGGQYEEQQKSFHDLLMVLFLALLLLFAVLLFEFRTFAAPLAILASALLSTFGAFVALLITRIDFNVSSFMGMIMVIGIVAKNGILLVDAEQRFNALGYSPEDAMIQAVRRRLRPIAMTALATIAGMFPLALAIGAGSQMLQPLAIAVIGGLLSSMVLSLIFTPAIHYYLSGGGRRELRMSRANHWRSDRYRIRRCVARKDNSSRSPIVDLFVVAAQQCLQSFSRVFPQKRRRSADASWSVSQFDWRTSHAMLPGFRMLKHRKHFSKRDCGSSTTSPKFRTSELGIPAALNCATHSPAVSLRKI